MTELKVSKSYVLMTAYNDIKDVKQKIGNLSIYESDDVNNQMFSTPRIQLELGKATDLGFRMVNASATEEELIRLFRYRFAILANVDKNKRRMDYKQAYRENNIQELRKKYITSYKLD